MPSKSIIDTVNYIRQRATADYQNNVPAVNENSGIQDIANPILQYDSYQNEFISGLVNRIAFTMFSKRNAYENPLKVFKKGRVPLGMDIQNIFTNPAKGMPYEMSSNAMSRLLQVYNPDTKVEYFRRNRQWTYPVTISNDQLAGAFVSWDALEELIAQITNSLYSGNYIDEFKITKNLVTDAVNQNKIIKQVIKPVTNKTSADDFLATAREIYLNMSFPSTKYNAYSMLGGEGEPVTTWTESDRLCIMITAHMMSQIDVKSLAGAFNIDSAKLMGRIFVIDSFGDSNIQAVLFDESLLQIYDNMYKFTTFYNSATLTWNYYFHAWNTFAISCFANAVAFVLDDIPTPEPTDIPLTAMTVSPTEIAPNTTETLTIAYTPANATVKEVTGEITTDIEGAELSKMDNTTFNLKVPESATAESNLSVKFTSDNGTILNQTFTVVQG